MKKMITAAFVGLMLIAAASCASISKTSHFNSETVRAGMEKQELIKRFGKPYKEDFFINAKGTLTENLYYKEIIFKGLAGLYELNSILKLEDGKLISYEMGEEHRLTEQETRVSVSEKN